jgi:hypothetical protein
MRIINHSQDGRVLGGGRQEAECRRSHSEPVTRRRRAQRQGTRQRSLLRAGNPIAQAQDRAQQLRQTRKRQLRLRLKRTSSQNRETGRYRRDDVREENCLPDPRLAVNDQRHTVAAARPGDQRVELLSLVYSAD